MEFTPVRPDLVRFEMRMVQGQDPHVREQKKPGAFGRFLSGIGKVLGSVAMPLSFLFPPAAIGDQLRGRAYQKEMEKVQREQATTVAFPGLASGPGEGIRPASGTAMSPGDEQVMNVLFKRNDAMIANTREF